MKPDWLLVVKGLIPNPDIIRVPGMLYVAVGILGEQASICIVRGREACEQINDQ